MAGTTLPPETGSVTRFDAVERALHWVNAGLFAVLIVTGAALYVPALASLVGRRPLVAAVHLYCGLALPVPVAASVLGPWGAALRADLRRLNRWNDHDRRWLRLALAPRAVRQEGSADLRLGKFNAGQKLNAAFVAGAATVMLGTGVIMRWYGWWPLSWRTGATFVHDWLAVAVAAVIAGHVAFAVSQPAALRSMVTGRVSRRWARRHAPAWLDEPDVGATVRGDRAEYPTPVASTDFSHRRAAAAPSAAAAGGRTRRGLPRTWKGPSGP
jgi:formate dehydrogenase subunit gamma